ncbi:hypothetical protein [Caldimonas brevitalea]|uniref:OmpA-like domain-containing protein n=1 Tax=Caldimonas brevitalea TaxID=413882 RepID=A0A0G3BJI8_9BURK|nr:hypothetical protein [Caldimonas brevitalea]AKJ28153.1 hypothetical protein AAW51_1462 [Caldimonas brevitalea]
MMVPNEQAPPVSEVGVASVLGAALLLAVLGYTARQAVQIPSVPAPAPVEATAPAPAAVLGSLRFVDNSTSLPPEALDLLARAAQEARTSGRNIVIAARHRAVADPEAVRAQVLRVQHALEANGVSPAQLLLATPDPTLRTREDGAQIELRLQD